jgi:hypothetical protein
VGNFGFGRCFGGKWAVVKQVIDTAEKDVRRHGCEPFDPPRHEAGGNTQENGESLIAAFQTGESRHDPLMNQSIHTSVCVHVSTLAF